MGLFRLLILIAIVATAVWLWRRFSNRPKVQPPQQETPAPMIRCAHCGVHVPRDVAINQDANWYCSPAHRVQGPAAGGR